MVSKTSIYFGLLLAIVLLISFEVAANAAETTTNPSGVGDAKYGGGYQEDGRGGYNRKQADGRGGNNRKQTDGRGGYNGVGR
ncbi:hypothetical protein FF1_045668 [Malus domestica]|uniref:Glycine-rich protein n=1 Tax=Malus domestica TaxID=3750 RepID=A0A498J867_MALDO|nr:cold and drought-regulated protein CORA-like [Malus domestica]RXH90062.1 hypothetical protein DVH24_032419 [Malus domestica]